MQQPVIIHFVTMISPRKIAIGIVLSANNAVIGENGIAMVVINVSISFRRIENAWNSLGAYGTTLPCQRCEGKDGFFDFF